MLTDIYTMMWKEWKEYFPGKGKKQSSISGLLMILLFSIMMPIQSGKLWVETPVPLSLWFVIPLLLMSSLVADSFAGERERHTLETLLASRLPDQAILLGKIWASVLYVWSITQIVFVIALIPVNIIHGDGKFLFYDWNIVLAGVFLSLMLAALMSSIGVLVSLKAPTVKQAQQKLGISTFLIVWAIPMIGIYALRFVPKELRDEWLLPIVNGDINTIAVFALLILVLGNIVLYALAKNRFQRSKLLLD